MNDDTLEIVRAFLDTQSTMALGTVNAAGQPETAPIFFVADDQLNLYWLSSTHVRHSINLNANTRVSAAVYPAVWDWNDIKGVQMEGAAGVIADSAARERILVLYRHKFTLPPAFDAAITASSLYVLRPSWLRWVDNSVKFGYKIEMEL